MSSLYNIVVQTLKLVDDDEGYPDYAEVIKTEYTGGDWQETKADRKSTRLNSSHPPESRMPSSA